MAPRVLTVNPDLVDIRHIASRLAVSVPCVRGMIDRREFPQPIRCGRLFRWRKIDVDKWLEDQAEAALAEIGGEA